MVVARKTPAAPPAPVPKPKKPKPVTVPNKRQPRRTRWLPAFLLLFFFYALASCPSDSPLCHSLDHVLDSPPVHSLVQHAHPYIAPAKPYAADAANLVRTHLVHSYNSHIAPRLHWFFVDQYWNGIIKPIYFKGLHPHLELHSRPYRIYYRRFLVPAFNDAAARANATYVRLTPHAQRYLSESRRHALNAYQWTRPHFLTAYRRLLPHARALADNVKLYALVVATKAGDARRRYVDPHVLRIWEKVAEPATAAREPTVNEHIPETGAPEPTANEHIPETAEVVTTPKPSTANEPSQVATAENEPTLEPSQLATTANEPSQVATTANEPSQVATTANEPSQPATTTNEPSTTANEPSQPATTTNSQPAPASHDPSTSVHATPVPASEHEAESAASIVAASLHASPSLSSVPSSVPSPSHNDEINDFLKEIGLSPSSLSSSPSPSSSSSSSPSPSPSPPPTNATPSASRREQTAKKRAEITARHEKWQAELDALVRAQTHAVRVFLAESRGAAVVRLARWPGGGDASSDANADGGRSGHQGRGVVRDVEDEAARLIRGVETYLAGVEDKLRARAYVQLEREREREVWMRVVEKVEKRLADKVRDVHREVHEWFVGVQTREIQEINAMAEQVKILADRAQADLGIDYAWLDDVTYYDWQKYHDLVRTSENFTAHAHKIQAQIEPAGTNALIDALNALEREVNEAVDGFAVVLGRVRRRAEGVDGVFTPRAQGAGAGVGAGASGDEGVGVGASGGDERESRERESGEGEREGEPRASILPVPVPVEPGQDGVFVGRAKEEVEQRLEGVSVEPAREEL